LKLDFPARIFMPIIFVCFIKFRFYLLALDGKLGNIDNDFRCLDEQHIIPNSPVLKW